MKKGIKKLIATLLVIAILVALFFVAKSCGPADVETFRKPDANEDEYAFSKTAETFLRDGDKENANPEEVPNEYTLVEENTNYKFYFNRCNLAIALLDKETGEIWYSNPSDTELAEGRLGTPYRSQLQLSYIDKTAITTGEKLRYSYTNDMAEGVNYYIVQHKEQDENGKEITNLRVIYLVGDVSPDYNVPYCLTAEQAAGYVEAMKAAGYSSAIGYIAKSRGYRPITPKDWAGFEQEKRDIYLAAAPDLGEHFDRGETIYTIIGRDDIMNNGQVMLAMEEALAAAGMTAEICAQIDESFGIMESAPDIFWIPVDYHLTNDGIDVKISSDEIQYDTETKYLASLDVLPFFGYGTTQEKGYMMVPDGSGAIINFNNHKTNLSKLRIALYGPDDGEEKTMQPYLNQQSVMPVYGIKKGNTALFAVIEQGDAIASVVADVAGSTTAKLNQCYPSFNMGAYEKVSLSSSTRQSIIYQYDNNDCDITVKYAILNGKKDNFSPDYNGMAKYYRNYLTDKGIIEKADSNSIPFNLELIGAYDRESAFLGIGYTETRALTTFDQAKTIIDQLVNAGITNISVNYRGWANGGLRNSVFNRIKVLSALGGKSGLKELQSYVEQNYGDKVKLFFEAELLYVYDSALFDGYGRLADASRAISREVAYHYQYDVVSKTINEKNNMATIVGPEKLQKTAANALQDMQKLGITGVSMGSMGTALSGHYKAREGEMFDREDVSQIYSEITKSYSDAGMTVMCKGVNSYLLSYADRIFEVSNTSSGFVLADASIPFYQMVIHGSKQYSGEAFNLSGNAHTTYLQAVEAGAGLYYRWCYVPNSRVQNLDFEGMYSLNYEAWLDSAIQYYKAYNEALGSTAGEYIASHEILADGVSKVTYEGGKAVYVNYNSKEFKTADGVTVPAQDYIVTGGGN